MLHVLGSDLQVLNFKWIHSVILKTDVACKTSTRNFLSSQKTIIKSKSMSELWAFESDLQLQSRRHQLNFKWISLVLLKFYVCKTLTRNFLSSQRAIIHSKSTSELWVLDSNLRLWSERYLLNFKWVSSVVLKFDAACKTLTNVLCRRPGE